MKDLQQNSGAYKREVELLRTTTQRQKEQLQQLQELMILREQEHRFDCLFFGFVSTESLHSLLGDSNLKGHYEFDIILATY